MFKFTIIVFLVQCFSVNCWVINNIDVEALMKDKVERLDDTNALAPFSIDNNEVKLRLSLIYPGTKWCGAGDVANNFDDLGSDWRTDMCCREHDYCPDTITAGATKYNLTNDVFYTRLSCDCDEMFRQCLKATNSLSADNIGLFYFNVLNTKCFKKDYPVEKCVKKGGWLNKKCLVYNYNTTSEKIYQWFDVNNYR